MPITLLPRKNERLQTEVAKLTEQLSQANEELTQVNEQLQAEIAQRKFLEKKLELALEQERYRIR